MHHFAIASTEEGLYYMFFFVYGCRIVFHTKFVIYTKYIISFHWNSEAYALEYK